MKKKHKINLGKVSNQDLITNAKKVSREVFGIIPSKFHKNLKKYSRKQKHKQTKIT